MAPGTAQAWFGRISPRFGPPVRVNVFSDVTMAMVLFTVVLIWPEFGIGWFGTGGDPAASLPTSLSGQRWWSYTLSQVVSLVALGFAACAAGVPTRRAERESPMRRGGK